MEEQGRSCFNVQEEEGRERGMMTGQKNKGVGKVL
jgi:hypothetical protein